MIYFISHIEGISDRNIKLLIDKLKPIIKWNYNCISEIDGVDYKLIVNEHSSVFVSEFLKDFIINRNLLESNIFNSLSELKFNYESINISNRINYGVEFEYKCFERFFLINSFAKIYPADLYIHVDCDFLLSKSAVMKIVDTWNSNKENNNDYTIFNLNSYSTYLLGFNSMSISKFCSFISEKYLNNSFLESQSYRVCDMGALKSAIEYNHLHPINFLKDLDVSYLYSELMSFQPLIIKIAKYTNLDTLNWWNMDDVSDDNIQSIVQTIDFFKYDNVNYNISINGKNVYFTHFHGPTKRFIGYLSI
jgi:hypothetical protein